MNDPSERPAPTLKERIREAGGLYQWVNTHLIRLAGPAAVGPYDSTPPPTAAERAEQACPVCGKALSLHTFDRTRDKPLMHCP